MLCYEICFWKNHRVSSAYFALNPRSGAQNQDQYLEGHRLNLRLALLTFRNNFTVFIRVKYQFFYIKIIFLSFFTFYVIILLSRLQNLKFSGRKAVLMLLVQICDAGFHPKHQTLLLFLFIFSALSANVSKTSGKLLMRSPVVYKQLN